MVGRKEIRGRLHEWVFRNCRPSHTDLHATLRASETSPEQYRFNVRGEFGAIYVSDTVETSLRELDHWAAKAGLTRKELLPRVMLTLELVAEQVLDLTDPDTADAWGLTPSSLESDDYADCQEVAQAARNSAYEAILYPSARADGENFAVFLDRLKPGSHLRSVADPKEVPESGYTL